MSLWVDKHRPSTLDKLTYHDDLSSQLKSLAASGDIPHLLVHGPSGAGKKTRIMAFLKEVYGSGVEKLRIEQKSFETPSGKKIEISTVASNYHIEVNPSDVGMHDYTVVRNLLKEVAQSQQLDTSHRVFKVVVISEADKLTKDAQHALRRIMEKYMTNCRYILSCNSTTKVIPPIQSRCLKIRVAAPSPEEILVALKTVCKKESVKFADELLVRVGDECEGNLRRAILLLEVAKVQMSALGSVQTLQLADWEVFLKETCDRILTEQSPGRLLEVRGRLYELLTHCIPPDVVMRRMTDELIKNVDTELKIEIIQHAAFYEHRLQTGSKPIFHLEAFVAKFMSVYKKYLLELVG